MLGSISGEPRGTKMVVQKINLEQTQLLSIFPSQKLIQIKKIQCLNLNPHHCDHWFMQLEKLMKCSHRVVQLKSGPKGFVGAELLGLQPLCLHYRWKLLGPEPCEFQMGWPKKVSIQRLCIIIFFKNIKLL